MIVPLISFIYRPYFAYYNGSDEQIYLTYQAGLALLDNRGRWFSSKLVLIAHEIGISGAALNLILDIASPLLMFFMIAYLIKHIFNLKNHKTASWIIVYGSILFNQSNPFLVGLIPDFRYSQTFWVSAYEGFAPYIRSPEPQISIILILIAIILYLRTHLLILLLLPIPFLYENVILPYIYIVTIYLCKFFIIHSNSIYKDFLINSFAIVILSIAILIANNLNIFSAYTSIPTHYRHSHMPTLSLSLLLAISTVTFIIYRHLYKKVNLTNLDSAAIVVSFMQFFLSNHSIISGVSIFPQGLQSVGGTFGSAFLLFYLTQLIKISWLYKTIILIISLMIIWSINSSQGLKISENRYRLQLYHNISKDDLISFRANSLGYIGGTQLFKGYIALAYPKQLTPLTADFYKFHFFMSSCEKIAHLHKHALQHMENNLEHRYLKPFRSDIEADSIAIQKSLNKISKYKNLCPENIPKEVNFKIYPNKIDTMVLIQLIPPKIQLQGRDF
jgi:hypothetical protein